MANEKYIEGLSNLIKDLERIPKELDDQLDKVVSGNAAELEKNAKKIVPVDSGKLKQSIGKNKIDNKEWEVKTNTTGLATYGVYVEYGTSKMSAQPFMFPSLFKQRPIFFKDIENLLKKVLKK